MRTAILSIVFACLAAVASASTVVGYGGYQFNSAPSFEAAGVMGKDLSHGSGLNVDFNRGTIFSWEAESEFDAFDLGDFLMFGFTSSSAFDVTSVVASVERNPDGPRFLSLIYSVNGGNFISGPSFGEDVPLRAVLTFDLNIKDVTRLDFFLVGWWGLPFGDRDLGGFSINPVPLANVSPSGLSLAVMGQSSLAPVPLPASGLLLFLGAGALAALRRRRG